MFSVFSYAFNAISPILLLVLIGYYLSSRNIFSKDFFKIVNRFAFHYSFPALMFTNIYSLGGLADIDLRLAGVIMFSIVVLTLLSILATNLLTNVRNRKGVLIQAGFRSNFAVIGLPLAEGMLGAQGSAVAAAMQLPVVIYFNFFSVFILAIYSDNAKFEPKKVAKNLITNPLIQGLGMGAVALVIRALLPRSADGTLVVSLKGSLPWLYSTLTYLAKMATPLSLISLGGLFNFSAISGVKKELIAGVLMRLVFAPLIGFGIAFTAARLGLLDITSITIGVMIAAYGSPIAVSSAVMASEMHADDVLAGQILVWSCFFSLITIFAQIVLFRSLGML